MNDSEEIKKSSQSDSSMFTGRFGPPVPVKNEPQCKRTLVNGDITFDSNGKYC